MSRKLRLEETNTAENKNEEEHVEDKFAVQLRRIYSPLVWKRVASGFRIQDLKEKYYGEVVNMFKEHFLSNDVLCKNTELMNDNESLECYLKRLLFQLKDSCSIIAVDENYVDKETEETREMKKPIEEKIKIVGALILKVINKSEFNRVFSRVQLIEGQAMEKCIAFKSYLNRKIDIFAKCNCESFLRYYELCVIPDYRHMSLGYHLMSSGLSVARTYNIPVVAGLFPNSLLQNLARKLGMETICEINYCEWRDREGELIFDDPGAGNYSCAIMAGPVPPPLPQSPSLPTQQTEKTTRKLTRAEKQAALVKK